MNKAERVDPAPQARRARVPLRTLAALVLGYLLHEGPEVAGLEVFDLAWDWLADRS